MTTWTSEELTRVGAAEELEIAFLRRDGTLGRPRTIWVVPYRDGLYVRSVNGPTSAWYRGAQVRRQGHIRAGGIDKDVAFAAADPDLNDTLDRITSPEARSTTIQLVPS